MSRFNIKCFKNMITSNINHFCNITLGENNYSPQSNFLCFSISDPE